jgi:hypothetical protein
MISVIPFTLGIIEIFALKPITILLNKKGFIQLDFNVNPEIKQTTST